MPRGKRKVEAAIGPAVTGGGAGGMAPARGRGRGSRGGRGSTGTGARGGRGGGGRGASGQRSQQQIPPSPPVIAPPPITPPQLIAPPPAKRTRVTPRSSSPPWSASTSSASTISSHVSTPSSPTQSFSQRRCVCWFREYVSDDDPEIIGPEGVERFCKEVGVEPENIVMLVLAWKMGARQMGFFRLDEWTKGLQDLKADSLVKLRQRLGALRDALRDPHQFKAIYRYAYDFARDRDQRCLDLETGKAMLELLLGPQPQGAQPPWVLCPHFMRFLEQSKYRVINRDQWFNVLEFCRSVLPDLTNYDVDGAWPVMLDEFVEWLKNARAQSNVDPPAAS